MNREALEQKLNAVGVSLNGWMPVLQCNTCQHRWEPFHAIVGANAPTVRFDYWRCPKGCNATAQVGRDIRTMLPDLVVINDIPGMVFGDEDREAFERYVRSMDLTEIPNRDVKDSPGLNGS